MRYKPMGQNRTHRLNIPQMLGGLNTATDPALIDDDELAEVCNLTFDHGALVTREAVKPLGDAAFYQHARGNVLVDIVSDHPIVYGGKLCAVVATAVSDSTQTGDMSIHVLSLDGAWMRTYTMPVGAGYYQMVVAACDKETIGAEFMLFYASSIYIPDDASASMRRLEEDKLYAPLVAINGKGILHTENSYPSYKLSNGVSYEGFNLLTNRYRVKMTPCGATVNTAEYFCLPTKLAAQSTVSMEFISDVGTITKSLTVGGEAVGFSIGAKQCSAQAFADGYVKVTPALPASEVSNTLTFTCVGVREHEHALFGASLATWFGGTANQRGGTRLFLANRDKSRLMWSDVNNPLYFSENNYVVVGDPSQKITALDKQGDMLVIFKERELFYTTYVQGEIDTDAIADGSNVDITATLAYFPLTQLSPQIGCRCPHSIALCRDRLVWMDSDARVYTLVVTGQYSERNVREIGQKVRPYLLENTTEQQRVLASAVDHRDKYRAMIGDRMIEFDYNEHGFVNVSGYYTGERAARNIAWMTHEFAFGDATQMLVSDGAQTVLIISTATNDTTYTRTAYTLDAASVVDRYIASAVREHPITISLTTKTYEFGDPAAFKRIDALFVMMQADAAQIHTVIDGVAPRYGVPYKSADTFAHLVKPCVKRCRTMALRITATGHLCLKGLRMQYNMFGTVK